MQNGSPDSITKVNRKIQRMNIHLFISFISLVIMLFLYFYLQEFLNLFYYSIFLIVVIIILLFAIIPRLKAIETTLASEKNIKYIFANKRGSYAGLMLIAALLVLLISSFIISLFIIVLLLFFYLNELKLIYKQGKLQKVFQKSPAVLFSIFIILIAVGFSLNMIPEFFLFLIEISITFVFSMFLFESFSEIEVPKGRLQDGKEILMKKVDEIFGEKTCEVHPSQIPQMFCLRCNRHICEICKTNYEDLCAYCYKQKIENRLLFFKILTYLSMALFAIFLISFIWGMYAPLPQILRFIEWLGLKYSRFTILFYYATANFIILISVGGGGLVASRQLIIKLKQLEDTIK